MRNEGFWWLALAGAVVIVLCAARFGGGAASSDEALWLAQGLALDLPHSDREVRAALVSATQRVAMRGHTLVAPTEAQLRAHYAMHRARFAERAGLQVRRIAFSENGESVRRAWQNAVDAYRRLAAGDDFVKVRKELGDSDPIAIPEQVITEAQLQQLLGMDMALSVLRLRAGQISRPVEEHGFIFIYDMRQRNVALLPAFEAVRGEVLVDYQRAARDAILASYLAPLRRGSVVGASVSGGSFSGASVRGASVAHGSNSKPLP